MELRIKCEAIRILKSIQECFVLADFEGIVKTFVLPFSEADPISLIRKQTLSFDCLGLTLSGIWD